MLAQSGEVLPGPSEALKGWSHHHPSNEWLPRTLVGVQLPTLCSASIGASPSRRRSGRFKLAGAPVVSLYSLLVLGPPRRRCLLARTGGVGCAAGRMVRRGLCGWAPGQGLHRARWARAWTRPAEVSGESPSCFAPAPGVAARLDRTFIMGPDRKLDLHRRLVRQPAAEHD